MSRKRNWAIIARTVRELTRNEDSDAARANAARELRARYGRVVGMEFRTFLRTVRAGGASIPLVIGVARIDRNRYTGIGLSASEIGQ